jgi:hypothetical protein
MSEMPETPGNEAPPVPVAQWTGRTWPAVGRTRRELACPCGHVRWVYVWSMAGHGGTRCPACRGWIRWDLSYTQEREQCD